MPSPRRNFQRKRSQLHMSFTAPEDIPEPLSISRAPLPSPSLRNSSVVDARKATLLATRKMLHQRRVDAISRSIHNQEVDHYYYKTYPELHKIYDLMSSGKKLSDALAEFAYDDHDLTPLDLHKLPQERWWEYITFWRGHADKLMWRKVDATKAVKLEYRRVASELATAKHELVVAEENNDSKDRIKTRREVVKTLQCSLSHFEKLEGEYMRDAEGKLEDFHLMYFQMFDLAADVDEPDLPTHFDIYNPFDRIYQVLFSDD